MESVGQGVDAGFALRRLYLVAPAGGEALVTASLLEWDNSTSWVKWSPGTITDLDERFFEKNPSRELIEWAARDKYGFETCLDVERLEYLIHLARSVTRARGYWLSGRFEVDAFGGEIDFIPPDLAMTCFGIVAVEYWKAIERVRCLPADWSPCWGGGQ